MSTINRDDIAGIVDDRSQEGIFRVRGDAFIDPQLFELEMVRVFESTWIFLGLESQVARPHDFMTAHIGRQPVLIARGADGKLGCFLNICRHRGTLLCPLKKGNQRVHLCRYHGWVYDSSGRNVSIPGKDIGQYPPAFDAESHDLIPVARFKSYRGLMFASLSADVPTLEDHLGDARIFLDLVIDQAPTGLEYLPGSVNYTFDANWKFQFENGLDYYHFETVHSSFVEVLKQRATRAPAAAAQVGMLTDPAPPGQGTFSFGAGHSVMWSIGVPGQGPESRPLGRDAQLLESAVMRFGESAARWMLRHRNLTIFPNLQIIDIQSLQFRTWRPLAVDKTEMTSNCVAPIGENPEARRFRIRQYEDFFNPSGLATSDDNIIYEFCQDGFQATAAGATQGHVRGLGTPPDERKNYAAQLGLQDSSAWTYGPAGFGDETGFHAGWREWHRLLMQESDPGIANN